jgi:DNA-binding protein YbaB
MNKLNEFDVEFDVVEHVDAELPVVMVDIGDTVFYLEIADIDAMRDILMEAINDASSS